MNLEERFITINSGNNKEDLDNKSKYFDDVIRILKDSYAPIGGLVSLTDDKEILNPNYIWKLVRRNEDITAVALYKGTLNDRKLVLLGRDKNLDPQAKNDLYMLIKEDIKDKNRFVWGEVSGALEHIFDKFGANTIPSEESTKILARQGKLTTKRDKDHYDRRIGNKIYTKKMIGNVPDKYLDDDKIDSPFLNKWVKEDK